MWKFPAYKFSSIKIVFSWVELSVWVAPGIIWGIDFFTENIIIVLISGYIWSNFKTCILDYAIVLEVAGAGWNDPNWLIM